MKLSDTPGGASARILPSWPSIFFRVLSPPAGEGPPAGVEPPAEVEPPAAAPAPAAQASASSGLAAAGAAAENDAKQDSSGTPCSKLRSYNGRAERLQKVRSALLVGAGGKCPTELANVVYHTLGATEIEEFQRAFEKLASPQQALERAFLQEAASHPNQTARSAVARAADAAGQSLNSVSKRLGLRISGRFLSRAKERPQGSQRQQGGRKKVISCAEVTASVRELLMKHSKETSRYCRTKARHQKAWRPTPHSWMQRV